MNISRFVDPLLSAGLLLTVWAVCPASAGSPFYLTVDRSFASTEKPQLRLDYTISRKPMVVRVLRPRHLERFLDGQLHLSRSYEPPVTELNPGYYFVTGLNAVESPLKALRAMLDVDFRKSLTGTALNKAILDTTPGNLAARPEQIVPGPPEGFAVVREYYEDLEYGGKGANDLGWWFADEAWREDRYQIRKIELDPLADGVYLVQAVQGKTEAQCLLQVSSLAVQVKQSSEQLVVRVMNRSLDPVAGATVSIRDGRGKWRELEPRTSVFGEMAFTSPDGTLDGRLVILAQTADGRQALVDTDFLPTTSKDNEVFMVTDRPIFKPGESFFYKGVVRAFENGELRVPDVAAKQARVTLIRADGTPTDLHADVPVTGYGSFSGSFGLDETQTPGLYRLVAEIEGKPYGGEFRVRDYVKPTFYLELLERSPTVTPGERFVVKFKAKRYSGGAPQHAKYEVFLYRKKFEAPQWVVEAGGGLGANTDYYGEIRSAAALIEPQRLYSSIEARLAALGDLYVTNTWDSAPEVDDSGEGRFEFDIPKIDDASEEEWIYTLMVRALDRAGSQAVFTENLYVTLTEAQPVVRFSDPVGQVGQTGLAVLVRSTTPDGKPAPQAGGVIDILLEQSHHQLSAFIKLPFTTDDQGICRIALPELTARGKLSAVATLETLGGKPMKRPAKSQSALMIVGGTQGESVLDNRELELYTAGTLLSPGEKAKVFALLPTGWGKAESGTIWETLAGQKIYQTRPSEFQGRSRWFEVEARPEYGTGFYHTITVPMSGGKYREQTLGFRIIPRTKRLTVAITPDQGEAEPLKPLNIELEVKDAKGEPAADTELAVTIVDRAVYAVQAELRPGVFDFFYPLPRLNLATFYSDDLQGYGYADLLKKPNFKLGALKSQSKLTKRAMRDTAGWFPHVVTDARGRASITVDLPANVTEWLITAIATDRDGRVGEAQGKFRTSADVSVEVLAPQFLREGEEAALQVKTVNHLAQSISVQSRLRLEGEATLQQGGREVGFVLGKQGEHLRPLVLAAQSGKGAATLKVGLEAKENIHVGGVEEFEIPLKAAAMQQILSGTQQNQVLTCEIPETSKITELKVQVSSGLLGAALNAAAVLVSYPYGCTEQLVHSTIPNLVLLDLVQKAGLTRDQLGPLAVPLTQAQKHAALGIKRIIGNQKTDGGFGLWPSDPGASLPVTLTALYALKFADELKIAGASRSFNRGVDWLERARGKNLDQDRELLGYELSRIAEIGNTSQPWKQQIAYVQSVQGEATVPLSDLIYALRIFAAHKEKSWSRFNQTFKDSPAREDLIEKLNKALEQFDPAAYAVSARAQAQLTASLGFGFGGPTVISAGLGVLDELQALSPALQDKLKHTLLTSASNGFWVSTFDTAQVIFNARAVLSREAAAFAQEQEDGTRKVVVRTKDGAQLGELVRIPAGFVGSFALPGTPANLTEIQLDGLTADEVASSWITAEVPYTAVQSRSQGLIVERTFLRITPGGSEILDLSKPLHRGDRVVSEVRVRRAALPDVRSIPSQFLVVEDGIPSFAQAIDDDATVLADAKVQPKDDSFWESIKETQRHPDKTVRVAKVLPTGEIRIVQVWQVAFAGKATIPPARAFDMYDQSLQANTETYRVRAE
jgi:alpha-2-macroglobulin